MGLDVFYHLMDVRDSPGALPSFLDAAQTAGFAGVNITHPCKQAVIPLLDELSAEARAIGAVNTVTFTEGKRRGHNTDVYGFARSFRRGLEGARSDSVLLIGAGGAGSAVAFAAVELGIKRLHIYDRDHARAVALAARMGARAVDTLTQCDGLIHATPVGMAAHPGIAVPGDFLQPAMWVAEVVYFPLETQLLKHAHAVGCRTLDGGGMAVYQAAKTFELFTGSRPDEERMLRSFANAITPPA